MMPRQKAFTLLEVLITLVLTALAMSICFAAFSGISRAWQRGLALVDDLNHGDYVLDQVAQGLRCAFFPVTAGKKKRYGFILENNGDGQNARDAFSWVKTGGALLRAEEPLRYGTHRVRVSVEPDQEGEPRIVTRAWRPYVNLSSFTPEQINPFALADNLSGMDVRVATNRTDEGWEWENQWDDDATNHLPLAVEITLYWAPAEEDQEPVITKRLVEIPVGERSWTDK